MLFTQIISQQTSNNLKNNGNTAAVTTEITIVADITMEMEIKIIIAVVQIITTNNNGEDHVSFESIPFLNLFYFFDDRWWSS